MSEVIFTTVHGSHLYGLAHASSDVDTFTVTKSLRKSARQSVNGADDSVRVGMNTFLIRALGGSHQSVEALFSPRKEWNPEFENLRPMIENMVVCGSEVFAKYERTIRKFCFGDFKRRRHAVRLTQNLQGLREHGRFNPEMKESEKMIANSLANLDGEVLWKILMG